MSAPRLETALAAALALLPASSCSAPAAPPPFRSTHARDHGHSRKHPRQLDRLLADDSELETCSALPAKARSALRNKTTPKGTRPWADLTLTPSPLRPAPPPSEGRRQSADCDGTGRPHGRKACGPIRAQPRRRGGPSPMMRAEMRAEPRPSATLSAPRVETVTPQAELVEQIRAKLGAVADACRPTRRTLAQAEGDSPPSGAHRRRERRESSRLDQRRLPANAPAARRLR